MNPVLTQLTKAQEAYMQVVQGWTDVDTTDVLLSADAAIKAHVLKGLLVAGIGGIADIRVAEKAAIELQELGYAVSTCQTGFAPQPDGSQKPLFGININWRYMPANSRDLYTT